ncbi:spore germination protein GerPC [Paenibacillus sp. NPDC058071]|uniref:spore germination protein GerPC n=1 Tax=Paenibacillus sp. NPDC058071 TaxID=3346326 RepID=UPI0036DD45B9
MQQQPNNPSPWIAWSQDVQAKLSRQEAQIAQLEEQLAAMCAQLKTLESKPTYHIDNLQYHFDQLKVEKLEGTLNIGMTPPGAPEAKGEIEQASVSKPLVFPAAKPGMTPPEGPYGDIRQELDRYLDNEASKKLIEMEKQVGIPLDPYHRRMIIEDIRKQLPTRIQFYVKSAADGTGSGELPGDSSKADVIAKTQRDADAALMQYLQQLKGPNSNP